MDLEMDATRGENEASGRGVIGARQRCFRHMGSTVDACWCQTRKPVPNVLDSAHRPLHPLKHNPRASAPQAHLVLLKGPANHLLGIHPLLLVLCVKLATCPQALALAGGCVGRLLSELLSDEVGLVRLLKALIERGIIAPGGAGGRTWCLNQKNVRKKC